MLQFAACYWHIEQILIRPLTSFLFDESVSRLFLICKVYLHVGVSQNRGFRPKSSILIGCSIINIYKLSILGVLPLCLETRMYLLYQLYSSTKKRCICSWTIRESGPKSRKLCIVEGLDCCRSTFLQDSVETSRL